MSIQIRHDLQPADLSKKIARLWDASAPKILSIDKDDQPGQSAPVFTIDGRYTARGWTEWTQGFVYGAALLQYDATGDESFLELGRERTFTRMAHHITHVGVHDHGFNNVSTYGNLLRLLNEGRLPRRGRTRARVLRVGTQVLRRGPGCALDRHRRRHGVHLLFQRPAFAVCRHDPLAARAGDGASPRPCAHGRTRRENLAARPPVQARPRDRQIQRLLWRGPRLLRPARTGGARERFQPQQR